MHRWWLHLLGALALVLTLWTGGTARAAEDYAPIAVPADTVGHFAGDRDEVPTDQHQGVPHHHFACGEHAAAALNNIPAAARVRSMAATRAPGLHTMPNGREPDTQIRPPIA